MPCEELFGVSDLRPAAETIVRPANGIVWDWDAILSAHSLSRYGGRAFSSSRNIICIQGQEIPDFKNTSSKRWRASPGKPARCSPLRASCPSGRGMPPSEALHSLGQVAEGVRAAKCSGCLEWQPEQERLEAALLQRKSAHIAEESAKRCRTRDVSTVLLCYRSVDHQQNSPNPDSWACR